MSGDSKSTEASQKQVVSSGRVGRQLLNQLGVSVVSKLIPLASIFVYSRYMSVADYGVLNLSQSYLWIFVLVLSLNLHVSVGRYIYEPNAEEGPFLASTVIAVGVLFFIGSIGIYFASDRLVGWLNLPFSAIMLMLAIVLGALAESLLTQLAIHDHRGGLLFISLASKALLSFLGCVILLHVLTEKKYMAILLAESFASVGLCFFVAYLLRRRIVWRPRKADVLYMAKYALPLIPYMLSLTLQSQFDRVLLNKYYGNEVTGYYSLGYNIGALLMMAVSAALNALTPAFFDALNKGNSTRLKHDSDAIFNFAVIATAAIVLFGPDAASLILPPRYREGFSLIPIVALGGLCSVIFQSWIRVLAFEHRTFLISGIAVLGATLSIGLNLWLLPRTGYQTAAYTALMTSLSMSLLCVVAVNWVSSVSISLWREMKWIALIGVLLPMSHFPPSLPLVLLKLLLLLGCIWSFRETVRAFVFRGAM